MTSQFIYMYLLKSIAIAGIFVLYYWLVLRNKKFHYYNRFYLLGALTLSITVPLFNLNWFSIEQPVIAGTPISFNFNNAAEVSTPTTFWDWKEWILFAFLVIGFIFLLLLVLNIIHIYRLKRKAPISCMEGFDFISVEDDQAPFSFLNNLFWKNTIPLNDQNGQKIFKHEITHIHQKHTWDRLYCQIVSSILWVNPFCWLIQKELQTIHEFIADEEAVGNNDVASFAQMLLQTHYGHHFLNPTHSFFYSSIKRRLSMLTKSQKTRFSYLRRLIVLPITLCVVLLMSFTIKNKQLITKTTLSIRFQEPTSAVQVLTDTIVPVTSSSKARKKGKPVQVNVDAQSLNNIFVTSKDGDKDAKMIIVNIDGGTTYITTGSKDMAQRILKTDSSVKQITVAKENGKTTYVIEKGSTTSTQTAKKPIYILDGREITESDMKAINPNTILTVNVLKGDHAITKYGTKGADGVVEIKTKQ